MEISPGTTATTRAILGRRSIRTGFDPDPLEPDTVREIVACGCAAPSSKNSQPWRIHVVNDRDTLVALAHAVLSRRGRDTFVPHDPATSGPLPQYRSTVGYSAQVLLEVPLAMVVENLGPFSGASSGLLAASPDALASALFGYGLEMFGCGAAVQNMWLAAEALGLRAAFLGDVAIAEREIRDILGLSGDLVGALAVGRSDASPVPPMDAPAMSGLDRVVWR